jgi:hypothetical protein
MLRVEEAKKRVILAFIAESMQLVPDESEELIDGLIDELTAYWIAANEGKIHLDGAQNNVE